MTNDTSAMDKHNTKQLKLLLLLASCLLCVMMFFLSASALFRDMWFDEALTITTYTTRPNIIRIYFNYLIPNNHIIYTIFLKYWVELWKPVMGYNTIAYRLPSFVFGFATLVTILTCWRKRLGNWPAFITALCFSCSLPFAIYASAVRGYMLCFLLVLLAFDAALRLYQTGKLKYAIYYCAMTLLAVGTIPSSLIAFVGIVLYLMGKTAPKKYFTPRHVTIAIIPPLALIIFYLPIIGMFINSMSLKEGWASSWRSLITIYAGFIVAMLPLILFNLAAFKQLFIKKHIQETIFNTVIFLLPLIFIFRTPAPFPRLFFPLWPIWIIIIAAGTKHACTIISKTKTVRLSPMALTITLTAVILGYGIASNANRDRLSTAIVNGKGLDDYFSPYYMRPSFAPSKIIKAIKKETNNQPPPIYLSFSSSPYSFIFHGVTLGLDKNIWGFDNPDYKIRQLMPNSFAILSSRDNPQKFIKRFKVRKMTLIKDFGFHQLYYIEL